MTDSEQVPRGKGEKHPGEGSEIVTETICLQRAGAVLSQDSAVTVCLLKNDPTSLSKRHYKLQKSGWIGKPSVKSASRTKKLAANLFAASYLALMSFG